MRFLFSFSRSLASLAESLSLSNLQRESQLHPSPSIINESGGTLIHWHLHVTKDGSNCIVRAPMDTLVTSNTLGSGKISPKSSSKVQEIHTSDCCINRERGGETVSGK